MFVPRVSLVSKELLTVKVSKGGSEGRSDVSEMKGMKESRKQARPSPIPSLNLAVTGVSGPLYQVICFQIPARIAICDNKWCAGGQLWVEQMISDLVIQASLPLVQQGIL